MCFRINSQNGFYAFHHVCEAMISDCQDVMKGIIAEDGTWNSILCTINSFHRTSFNFMKTIKMTVTI
uniref:Uncharacterized protein n=1 Tax=Glossina morsitans morsitans TaxID=37546 RepID=A0A1B0G9G4_GLOMM